ncbi:hypothetical protein M9Y10_011769 [Tritrichomonas musculus]|uniref:Uncharacterized protein n=1 Tax=Tritrichomonas musculus TaxID=1915356 RepID=A0ABR2IK67_9EUKA
MKSKDIFEFSKATWITDQITMPAVTAPQPTGLVISFTFLSSWGGSRAEIQSIKVQDEEGNDVDKLIADKWFLNAENFPESIYFTLSRLYKPAFIQIENGISESGVKEMEIWIAERRIWSGEVPMGKPEKKTFAIALPIEYQEIKVPKMPPVRPRSA